MSVLKINSVLSTGEPNEDTVDIPLRDAQTNQVLVGEDGETPAIVFVGRPLPYADWQRRLKKYTKKVASGNGRGATEKVDLDAAVLDLLKERLVSWRGVVGADNLPLPCTPATMAHLDSRVQLMIASGLTGTEVSDFTEFRSGESD